MNVYDSERMFELLMPHGYKQVNDYEGADVIILNTCHIREKAAEKIMSGQRMKRVEKFILGSNLYVYMSKELEFLVRIARIYIYGFWRYYPREIEEVNFDWKDHIITKVDYV